MTTARPFCVEQKTFDVSLSSHNGQAAVVVGVHRKELPVSKSFGQAPFRFVFSISYNDFHEVVVTQQFFVQARARAVYLRRPKRLTYFCTVPACAPLAAAVRFGRC